MKLTLNEISKAATAFEKALRAAGPNEAVPWPTVLTEADAYAIIEKVSREQRVKRMTSQNLDSYMLEKMAKNTAEELAAIKDQLLKDYPDDLAMTTFGPLPVPERVAILNDGAALTNGDRDAEYGPPAVNMAAAGELKAVFRKHLRRDISAAELEALDLVFTKLGRIATGKPKRDTYVDGATYFAIAGEIALSEITTDKIKF